MTIIRVSGWREHVLKVNAPKPEAIPSSIRSSSAATMHLPRDRHNATSDERKFILGDQLYPSLLSLLGNEVHTCNAQKTFVSHTGLLKDDDDDYF